MQPKLTLLFAVVMALTLSSVQAAEVEPVKPNVADNAMINLMDRITRLSGHAIPVNTIPAELSPGAAVTEAVTQQHQNEPDAAEEEHEEKRSLSESFQQIGNSFSDLGGSKKNSTVSLWHSIAGDEQTEKEKEDEKKAEALKFINKRGNRNAPVPVVPKVKPSRNDQAPKVAAIPLTPLATTPMVKGAKRAEAEKRVALWDHVRRVANASSKRELKELHEFAKRSEMLEDLSKLASGEHERSLGSLEERNEMWNQINEVAARGTKKRVKAARKPLPAKSQNPKKRSLEGRAAVPHVFNKKSLDAILGSQNATFSGPGLSGVAGNGTVTLTFNSTEVPITLVNGTLVASAPLAITTLQAAVDQLVSNAANDPAIEVIPAPVENGTGQVAAVEDAHIATLEGVLALNAPTPVFTPHIPTFRAKA